MVEQFRPKNKVIHQIIYTHKTLGTISTDVVDSLAPLLTGSFRVPAKRLIKLGIINPPFVVFSFFGSMKIDTELYHTELYPLTDKIFFVKGIHFNLEDQIFKRGFFTYELNLGEVIHSLMIHYSE